MKCTGTCSIYVSAKGTLGAVVGAGSVDVTSGSSTIKGFKGGKVGSYYTAASVFLGDRKSSVKISGSNFTLVGIATAELKITGLANSQNSIADQDPSLDDPIQKALGKYGFNSGDFTPDWSVLPMVRGTTLEDPTLDLCSTSFDSELLRKERRQISVAKSGNPYLFSSETVRYKSVAAADQALSELKTSFNNCVKNNGGTESDGTFTKYAFQTLPKIPGTLVADNKRVIVNAQIGEGTSARYLLGVYQYNQDMFTGLYVVRPGNSPFTQDEISRWLDVAGVMAQRLKGSATTSA